MAERPISTLSEIPRSIITKLTSAGYTTVEDLAASSRDVIAKDLGISLDESQAILDALSKSKQAVFALPFSQTAAAFIASTKKRPSLCGPLDTLLDGGLFPGDVLELSGPPGSCKEYLAMTFACSVLKSQQGVIWVDMQNMMSPRSLKRAITKTCPELPDAMRLVHHIDIFSLTELLMFFHNLSGFLGEHSTTSLIVLNSISFPFQASDLTAYARRSLLRRIKELLARLCASRNVTIISTTQLSTKLLNPDGTPANFDTGSRAILVPQLGGAYLPSGRTHRVIVVPDSRTSGVLRLLSSPGSTSSQEPVREQGYVLVAGDVQAPPD